MSQRLLIFDLDSLLKLLVHYSEGEIPLTSEALTFEVSPYLQRYLSMLVQSPEWSESSDSVDPVTRELPPIHFRYEGNRVLKLNRPGDIPQWGAEGAVEAPKRQ